MAIADAAAAVASIHCLCRGEASGVHSLLLLLPRHCLCRALSWALDHPGQAVIDRFLAGGATGVLSTTDNNKLKKLHLQHGELRTQLKEVKMRKECMEEAMAKKRAMGDQIAVLLNPDLGDMGEEEMMAFVGKLMPVRVAISECANQVLLNLGMENIIRALQAPGVPLPQQLFAGSTFESGSTSTNTGMEMQQMHMAMPSTQGFAVGMDMHHMSMAMPPPGLAYGMNMQQILMSIPPPLLRTLRRQSINHC
ncbi:uncharacterized protein [Triticum aestivum]|uniref:uncharacterized protein n=1 Tax=Triticum aestivum TaxID=4565 RepID=UPI001D027700|nr:uncharacterized protein LOC123114537 [Triticum aestivum]